MSVPRVVIKRPWTHYVISLGYVLAPAVNILLVVIISNTPLPNVINRMFLGYGPLASIWLLTAPLVGIALYLVHKASWYVFLGHSALILVDYVWKWVSDPVFYWRSIQGSHQALILTGNIALIAVIGYIIHKDFRAPYFQVIPRGWRVNRRVPIRHRVYLNGNPTSVTDLSTTGCFVADPELTLQVGERVVVGFQAETIQVQCSGEVMRKTPDGYGIRFVSLGRRMRQDVRRMLRARFPFRYPVDLSGAWATGGERRPVTVKDISDGGCYLHSEQPEVTPRAEGTVEISVGHRTHRADARVAWVNTSELYGKPRGFGVTFTRKQARLRKAAVAHHKGGAQA